jgi:thiazole synthase ThiGH ThiG subunit
MTNEAYQEAADFTRLALGQVQYDLVPVEVVEIKHFLSHDECEMAFEGLFISIMKAGVGSKVDLAKALEIGRALELDQHSVWDDLFWSKFTAYIQETGIA